MHLFHSIKTYVSGLVLVGALASLVLMLHNSYLKTLPLSPLLLGVVLGIVLSPFFHAKKEAFQRGVDLCTKKILRIGIVLYGFNITLSEITKVGFSGIAIALIVVGVIFFLGVFLGTKFFKIDKDLSILISGGSAVCGAAAVLALESSIKSKPHKGIVAIGGVVLFGILGMFLYPLAYKLFLHQQLTPHQMGIYIGATLHEVANVVGAASSINKEATDLAITIKMIRLILLVPLLILAQILLISTDKSIKTNFSIPWFAFLFLLTVLLNSYLHSIFDRIISAHILYGIVHTLQGISTLFLVLAMTALGLQMEIKKFLYMGKEALGLTLILFIILAIGGFFLIKIFT